MNILKDLLLPLVVVAINIVLGGKTGHVLFYVMAAIILVLAIARFRYLLRNKPPE